MITGSARLVLLIISTDFFYVEYVIGSFMTSPYRENSLSGILSEQERFTVKSMENVVTYLRLSEQRRGDGINSEKYESQQDLEF